LADDDSMGNVIATGGRACGTDGTTGTTVVGGGDAYTGAEWIMVASE